MKEWLLSMFIHFWLSWKCVSVAWASFCTVPFHSWRPNYVCLIFFLWGSQVWQYYCVCFFNWPSIISVPTEKQKTPVMTVFSYNKKCGLQRCNDIFFSAWKDELKSTINGNLCIGERQVSSENKMLTIFFVLYTKSIAVYFIAAGIIFYMYVS